MRGGDAPRVVQVVDACSSVPKRGLPLALVVQLHRQADHVVARSASSAAATDESTPPDMATTIACAMSAVELAVQ